MPGDERGERGTPDVPKQAVAQRSPLDDNSLPSARIVLPTQPQPLLFVIGSDSRQIMDG